MRRFELLKDIVGPTLEAKALTTGVLQTDTMNVPHEKVWFDGGRFYFTLETCEKNSEWFREILPPTPNNKEKFLWTDELAKDFFIWHETRGKHLYSGHSFTTRIKKFKEEAASKLTQQEEVKRDWEIADSGGPTLDSFLSKCGGVQWDGDHIVNMTYMGVRCTGIVTVAPTEIHLRVAPQKNSDNITGVAGDSLYATFPRKGTKWDEERIKVSDVIWHTSNDFHKYPATFRDSYLFGTSDIIPDAKLPLVTQAIEQVLNDE